MLEVTPPGGALWDFCREAAIQNSPGLEPWVIRSAEIRPDSGGRDASLGYSDVILALRPTSGATFRAPFTDRLTQG